jgi:hypothetical protein
MDIGTKIIISPPTFMVRSCTVFPWVVWIDTILGVVLASEVIGVSVASTDAKSNTMAAVLRCFLIL